MKQPAFQNSEIHLEMLKFELSLTLPLLGAFSATTFDEVFPYEQSFLFQWYEILGIVGR